jgi:heme/copper-type cytochrome/quinol oxidase subunit 2
METRGTEHRNYRRYFTATMVVLVIAVLGIELVSIANTLPSAPTKYAELTLNVLPSNYQPAGDYQHAVFAPTNFTVYQGQIVNVTVLNYSPSMDSFTSPSLGVNIMFNPASPQGTPSMAHFQFVANSTGSFEFWCGLCHTANGQYSWGGKALNPGQPDMLKGYVTVLSLS